MGRRSVVLLAAAGLALLLYASRPATLFVPLGPTAAAALRRPDAAPGVHAWTPRLNPLGPAKMALMDRKAEAVSGDAVREREVDEGLAGLFGRDQKKHDPYNTEQMKQKRKEEQAMFDNLLRLKEKLEAELPFMFIQELDSSHFASDVVFKEPHLPPIRGRGNYQLFLRGLKDSGNLIFEEPQLKVVRATMHADDGLVKVRWKISGNYKSPFKLFQDSMGCFDGISYYNVAGSSGLVSVHQVDYNIPILPPVLKSQDALSWLDTAFAGVPTVPACNTVHSDHIPSPES